MSRELLILRHAKSAWDTSAATDFERPLAKRGRRDAPRVGRFLLDQGLIPDYVVSSPAERAKQTVIGVCEQLGERYLRSSPMSRVMYGRAIGAPPRREKEIGSGNAAPPRKLPGG